jgi:hypothetical protein
MPEKPSFFLFYSSKHLRILRIRHKNFHLFILGAFPAALRPETGLSAPILCAPHGRGTQVFPLQSLARPKSGGLRRAAQAKAFAPLFGAAVFVARRARSYFLNNAP